MRDSDHAPGTLFQRLAAQLGRAEFRYDNIDIASRRADAGHRPGNNPAAAILPVALNAMIDRPPRETCAARTKSG